MDKWLEEAKKKDEKDTLKHFRKEFYIGDNVYYMDGNSLGLMSKRAEQSLFDVMEDWKHHGIDGWVKGERPWFYMSENIGERMAGLVGAGSHEVLATNSTTNNIHQTVRTLYEPTKTRYKILADELNFPSDIYALQSVLDDYGHSDGLVKVPSGDGHLLKTDTIIDMMDESVALILLPSVLYRSGQVLEMEKITEAAHEKDIIVGFDLCHSIGALPHQLKEWNVDFAIWCTYKHLSGGPGSVAGLYVHEKHHDKGVSLKGWFGNNKQTQFDMEHIFDQAPDISQYQVGTPHIFSMAPLLGVLDIFEEAGIENIRSKSLGLTDFMIGMIEDVLAGYDIDIVTPKEHASRGGHILIGHEKAAGINAALKSKGVVPDFRAPGYVRIAPVALYNSFEDVYRAVMILKEVMDDRLYDAFNNKRGVVA
ncbi:kynureninase [Salinicoccus halodurans]|uniref:Kynureninase n=1 Tax=Salinicoccus halodurans TaxID=407035 RepID=A0A0F7HK19_9STAP|nr:kynureninase [Salinicoccus halodurans]AKG73063.1 kynureninase [Salinicoccus halodurans]SFK78335.1 Kynureninase [Salinicoccus halodurans]